MSMLAALNTMNSVLYGGGVFFSIWETEERENWNISTRKFKKSMYFSYKYKSEM
jgi:hypothetical protein